MSQKSGFFDAQLIGEQYDRVYEADDFAKYFSLFIGNGVFIDPINQLKVVPKSGLTVTLKAGNAFIDGFWYSLTEDMDFDLSPNSMNYAITDVIAITLNKSTREITAQKKEVVQSAFPVNNGTIHELVVCSISVGVGVSNITESMITDRRAYKEYCGFVTGMVDQIDTDGMYSQFEAQFNEWFSTLKGKLTEDVAGSLQLQIDGLEQKDNETDNKIKTLSKDFSDFKNEELSKTIVVTKTASETGGAYMTVKIPFPSGFTKDNCYIKSMFVNKIEGEGVGIVGYDYYGYNAQNLISIGAAVSNSDIFVQLTKMSTSGSFRGTYKVTVVLEKI